MCASVHIYVHTYACIHICVYLHLNVCLYMLQAKSALLSVLRTLNTRSVKTFEITLPRQFFFFLNSYSFHQTTGVTETFILFHKKRRYCF